jgi:hypothetical protein
MWHLIDSIVLHDVPIDPIKRLGLIDPSHDNLRTIACSFHAYHSIKHARNNPPSSLNYLSNSRSFAGAFIAAARDTGLQHSAGIEDIFAAAGSVESLPDNEDASL